MFIASTILLFYSSWAFQKVHFLLQILLWIVLARITLAQGTIYFHHFYQHRLPHQLQHRTLMFLTVLQILPVQLTKPRRRVSSTKQHPRHRRKAKWQKIVFLHFMARRVSSNQCLECLVGWKIAIYDFDIGTRYIFDAIDFSTFLFPKVDSTLNKTLHSRLLSNYH